ncbi:MULTISPECIES: substrate-binding periplasmic protein [Legionella]|uniref:Glutamine-binding periplasmic protein n=1 Tax=Legionella maceachernii TaxID=466 RepID=A0A0W0W448_9GAMM|nr:transporter substrate-binding domain-containing protein [Legionella maceachernii]KTD27148.1 glutamine-binding periplasmic protein precursor [Legionella maceachernii]SKA14013.1 polar amino acid transport system substrate-binding protein [Legionella maceachernii]SUP04844.1 Probable amino-acid-binding protein yxeM precursor [Legionella maceachernii]
MLRRLIFILFAYLLIPPLHAGKETIRIAHQNNYPPFVYVKNGKSVGLVVDILQAVATKQKMSIHFVPVPFAQVQKALTEGQAEAIMPLAITSERRKLYDFSTPLVMTGGALFVKSPEPTPTTLAALSGKIVVTPKTGPFASYIQETAPDINLVITENYERSFDYILSGKADAAALNFQVGKAMIKKNFSGKVTMPRKMFTELPLAVALKKGQHPEFLHRLNAGLAMLRTDGTLQWLYKKWKIR